MRRSRPLRCRRRRRRLLRLLWHRHGVLVALVPGVALAEVDLPLQCQAVETEAELQHRCSGRSPSTRGGPAMESKEGRADYIIQGEREAHAEESPGSHEAGSCCSCWATASAARSSTSGSAE